ncbi:hypothetical protein M8C21_029891 [Ambrosia artemisiifolia]|uniref:Uncharacterized protein n=1 Tax=Ambrosia artemisiifolia TaxID=4212 RepID=A0AAD5GK04_AMBAR|nr:hypothetical protein M8C21_029891 [Ambrosia artemisiifolia]
MTSSEFQKHQIWSMKYLTKCWNVDRKLNSIFQILMVGENMAHTVTLITLRSLHILIRQPHGANNCLTITCATTLYNKSGQLLDHLHSSPTIDQQFQKELHIRK